MADREFLLRIVGDVSDANKAIGSLDSNVQGFKQTASNIGKTIVAAVAVDQVVQFGKDIVAAASDQEQAIGAANSVFKEYSGTIQDFAKTTATNLGISRGEFSQLSAVTGALLKNAGVPMDQVTDSTIKLTERAADLAAMFGGTVPEAMEAINSGLKGELDPLEKFGVSLKASSVDAKAAALGYVDAEGKVTEYGRSVARIELIMEQSADAQGTFAKESESVAGTAAIMKAEWADLQAELGTKLLPVLVQIGKILRVIITFVADNQGWLIPLVAGIAAVVAVIKIWTLVQWALNSALLASPITWIVLAIAAIIAIVVLLYTKVDWFRAMVDGAIAGIVAAWNWLLDAIKAVFNWVSENWPLLLAIITGPIGIAVHQIVTHWDTIKAAVVAVFDWIKENWPLLLAILTGPFGLAILAIQRNWDTIKETASNAINAIKGFLANVGETISAPFKRGAEVVTDVWQNISDWFYRLPGKISGFFRGMAETITYPFKVAFDAIKWLWNSTVGGFGFTVPSWVPFVGGKDFRIPRMAAGGIVTRPTIAMIGEAGPEAVVPLDKGGFGNVTIIVNALNANTETGRMIYEALREYERNAGRQFAS